MKILNPRNLPDSFVLAAIGDPDKEPNPLRFGVNDLIAPAMARKLKIEHWNEVEEEVEDRFWLMLGIAWHEYMYKYAPEGSIAEEKIEIPWDDKYIISGIPDLYYKDTLIDYKLVSVWLYIYGGKKDWEAQLNVYRWMIYKKHGLLMNKLFIELGFKDWDERSSMNSQDYPPAKIMEVPVKIWDMGDTEKYIHARMESHLNLDKCTDEEKYHRPDTWAVMSKGRKTALRVLESEDSATLWMANNKGYFIEYRKGEDNRCKKYCQMRNFCPDNIYLKERA